MAATNLSGAPALSTPAEHLFEHVAPEAPLPEHSRSAAEVREVYEIERTAGEIIKAGWRRVALQFPDASLVDAPAVVAALRAEISGAGRNSAHDAVDSPAPGVKQQHRVYILADTSYSSCCVDEVAAEHVDAEVVVHYGRACLSPTSRLPGVYVFTKHALDQGAAVRAFEDMFPDRESRVVLMADVIYQDHLAALSSALAKKGYKELLSTTVVRNPAGQLPNREIVVPDEKGEPSVADTNLDLKSYDIFHVSDPPTALLLALSSRVKSLRIYPTSPDSSLPTTSRADPSRLLGRRYARVLSLSTAAVIGILVNTLSVANYLSSIDSIRAQIAAAGKKSYTVVVGKLNPAKLANFAEVDGWVVVGCWESSLVEDDAAFYRPIVTPFELGLALQPDDQRIWNGEWWGGIEKLATASVKPASGEQLGRDAADPETEIVDSLDDGGGVEGEESEPPEFDLRTGRLVSHSRPMARSGITAAQEQEPPTASMSTSLALRPKSDVAVVKGVASPGAEFLRSQRTWTGLGSDFDGSEGSASIEQGRSGIARGYTVGESAERR